MDVLRIRTAEPTDRDLLARWAQAMAWETEQRRLDPATVRDGVEAALADRGRAHCYIAMRDAPLAGGESIGVAVATLMVTHEWSDWRNGDWWWIQSVYVVPEHRRRGVFAALYREVERLARVTPGVIGLRLYVEKENHVAQRSYAALGMHDAGYAMYEQEFA